MAEATTTPRSQVRKNRTQILLALISILAGAAFLMLVVLSWTMAPYVAYYISTPSWGAWILFGGIGFVVGIGPIWFGFRILHKKEMKHSQTLKIIILGGLILGGSIAGICTAWQSIYASPNFVPLSTFDGSDWVHFDNVSWEANRDGYQTHYNACLGEFPSQVPLNPWVRSEEVLDGYRRVKMTITVEDSGRLAWDNMSFYILIPDQPIASQCPCVIIFHQHDGAYGKGKEEPVGLLRDPRQAFALELVKQGYVAVAADALCFSERQEISEYKTSHMLITLNRTLAGKYVWDTSRLIDFLVTQSYINASRIGIMGHSLGGQMAVYCGAYDSRLKVVVSNCGIGKILGNHSVLEVDGEENEAFYIPGLGEGPNAMDMKEIVGLINGSVLLSNGVKDYGLPIDGVAEIHNWVEEKYAHYGNTAGCVTLRHDAGHGIFPESKKIMWEFIRNVF